MQINYIKIYNSNQFMQSKQRQKSLTSNKLKYLKHNKWLLAGKYEYLTLRQKINERRTRVEWNPQYSQLINNFSHQLISKYLNNLQRPSIVTPKNLPENVIDTNENIADLYTNYFNFINSFYKYVIDAKVKGTSKIKKTLILIKEFNQIVGHRIIWPTVIKRRSKRRKLMKLKRFNRRIVPTRRMLIKIRFVIDKLFRWLYKLPKARNYFGHYINKPAFDYIPKTQIIYRKKLKIHLRQTNKG